MIKAWLIIFVLTTNPRVEDNYLGKVVTPYPTMADCRLALRKMEREGGPIKYQTLCVTDDHHHGRSVDPGVPLHF